MTQAERKKKIDTALALLAFSTVPSIVREAFAAAVEEMVEVRGELARADARIADLEAEAQRARRRDGF